MGVDLGVSVAVGVAVAVAVGVAVAVADWGPHSFRVLVTPKSLASHEVFHRIEMDFAAESNEKFVAAECGDQHTGSVRSPPGSSIQATTDH